jgi:hypothetical protein
LPVDFLSLAALCFSSVGGCVSRWKKRQKTETTPDLKPPLACSQLLHVIRAAYHDDEKPEVPRPSQGTRHVGSNRGP